MNWLKISVCVIVYFVQISQSIPIGEWDLAFFDEALSEERFANATSISEFAQELGVSEQFVQQLKDNWEKAVAEEKEKTRRRQAGGIGEFFGLGGGANGGSVVGGGGGNTGPEDDEDEDDDGVTMPPGPGAAGVLTGLFGIFSGLGSLNPKRVIQSTVNFFPPHQRVAAQMALDSAFGIHNVTTLSPLTDAPLLLNETAGNRPAPVLVSGSALFATTTPLSSRPGITTTVSSILVTDDPERKKLILKATSLLDDFEDSAVKLNPVVIPVEDNSEADKPRLSALEKEFADTLDIFKILSIQGNNHGSSQNQEDLENNNNVMLNIQQSIENATIVNATTVIPEKEIDVVDISTTITSTTSVLTVLVNAAE